MTAFLNDEQRHTLALVCQTLATDASATTLPDVLETALERVMGEAERGQFRLFLGLLESATVNLMMARIDAPFRWLTHADRERVLLAWGNSPLPLARAAFQGVKRLGLFLHYSYMPNGGPNPAWAQIGYAPPPPPESTARRLRPLVISADCHLTADALVIGSGAGGGVVAAELAAAGADVLIVEKGGYHDDGDFHGRELASTETLFEKYGALTTADLGMVVLAGSTVGGGTTINWSASLRTPDDVLHEWAHEYGFGGADTQRYQASLDAVCARLGLNSEMPANAQNLALERGALALGHTVDVVPRNGVGCEECGFCNFGCGFGAKQGTLKTYLQDAQDAGARLLVRARAERVLIEAGRAVGAVLRVEDANGQTHTVTVRARIVVSAGGALHSPALLLRSGLQSRWIGANLRLHPTTVVYGLYDGEEMRGWQGAPITRVVRNFADLDGAGYGFRLETAPVHPGIAALTTAWQSAAQHRAIMAQLNHLSNIIIIARDRYGGRVTVDTHGDPVLHYRLHPHDRAHLMRGILTALRVARAAGADEIASPHARYLPFRADRDGDFEAYLARVEREGLRLNQACMFSAHQMGSCRIAGSTALGALSPEGESYEVRGLFVADGSALPTSTGVNPMISIMGAAHYLAQGIRTRV